MPRRPLLLAPLLSPMRPRRPISTSPDRPNLVAIQVTWQETAMSPFISCRRSPAPPAPSSARRPATPPPLFVAAYRSSKRLTSSFRWPQPRATRHTGEELPAAVLEPIQPQPPKIPATREAGRSCASIVPLFQRSCYRPRHCSLPAKTVSVDLRQVPLPPSTSSQDQVPL